MINEQELLDELHEFKNKFNLSKEELKEVNEFIDSIELKIQNLNKKINKNNFEKLAKTVQIILKEAENG